MFLKSLPDKGKKIADMVKKLKQLIAEKEEFNSTMSRLEKMNISKKPAHVMMDSDIMMMTLMTTLLLMKIVLRLPT